MQATSSSLIIYPGYTDEERAGVIVKLRDRVKVRGKVQEAFNRLFGTQLPHVQIERLTRMNSRALTDEYNMRIFRILSGNPIEDFYQVKDYTERHELIHASDWNDGKLISRWEKYTKQPNPHHILPDSRGGSGHERNFWFIDRLTHNDFHTVFQNLTPTEQLILLLNIHKSLLSRDFSEELRKVLLKTNREPGCYRKGIVKGSTRKNWS